MEVCKGREVMIDGRRILEDDVIYNFLENQDALGLNVQRTDEKVKAEVVGDSSEAVCHLILSNFKFQNDFV